MQHLHRIFDVVIANGGTTSAAINVAGNQVVGFIFPASFEGATISFTAAPTATGTYDAVKNANDGSALTVYSAASTFVPVNPADLSALQYFKIVSASSVGADRTIKVIARQFE